MNVARSARPSGEGFSDIALDVEKSGEPPATSISRRAWVDLSLLSICWALNFSCLTASVSTTSIVAKSIVDSTFWATFPVAVVLYSVALSNYPVAWWLRRLGKRAGFSLGATIGIAGGTVCLVATLEGGNFALLTVGSALMGMSICHGMLYRFAALAFVPGPEHNSKAISAVLTGGCAGAILGPELAKQTRTAFSTEFLGVYLALVLCQAAVLTILQFIRFPPTADPAAGAALPGLQPKGGGGGKPLLELMLRPETGVATFVSAIIYFTMVFLMSPVPLEMRARGFSFDDSSLTIQLHMFFMYCPSFGTGIVIAKVGLLTVQLLGVGLYFASGAVLLQGNTLGIYLTGMILLGVGWNFLFVGATTMLAGSLHGLEAPCRSRVAATSDMITFMASATGSLFAGTALGEAGWHAMQHIHFGVTGAVAAALVGLWVGRRVKPLPAQ